MQMPQSLQPAKRAELLSPPRKRWGKKEIADEPRRGGTDLLLTKRRLNKCVCLIVVFAFQLPTYQLTQLPSSQIVQPVPCPLSPAESPLRRVTCNLNGFRRLHQHIPPAVTLIHKLNHPRDLGEQRIILASANIRAWLNAGAALPHNDRSTGDELPAKCLHAQTLCIRVASIP